MSVVGRLALLSALLVFPATVTAQAVSPPEAAIPFPAAGPLDPVPRDLRLLPPSPFPAFPAHGRRLVPWLGYPGNPRGIGPPGSPTADTLPDAAISPERAFLYSAILPGAGQYAQEQRRWMAYLAAEALGWTLHVERRRSGGRFRDRYRDLAWEVARLNRDGVRRDADFAYYERLTKWTSSGTWDAEPLTPGLQPESDQDTFNGAVWARARDLFLGPDAAGAGPGDPGWNQAVEYYRNNAYPPELLWDWRGNEDEQSRYRALLETSDDHFGEATLVLGIILANHVLSAADAFVSARLATLTGDRVSLRVRATPATPRSGTRKLLDPSTGPGPVGLPHPRIHLSLEIRP